MSSEVPLFQPFVEAPAAGTMNAAGTGEVAITTWRRIEDALWPIIGHAGMAALFKRSLYLARGAHPCLATLLDANGAPSDFARLGATLAQQSNAQAAAAQASLLRTFIDLLASLIGRSLTERLLGSVWDNPAGSHNPSSGAAVQDTSP